MSYKCRIKLFHPCRKLDILDLVFANVLLQKYVAEEPVKITGSWFTAHS